MKNIITLRPVKNKKISPERFMKLTEKEKKNIKKVDFIPPELGDKGFGLFNLIYKRPVYNG